MTRVRILLADDHTVVRAGLRALLDAEEDLEVVAEASDGRAACDAAQQLTPDVVVMDISMPGTNGAQATEVLRKVCPDTRVLALTVHEDRGYVRLLFQAGASGYVLKRAASDQLIKAVRTVAAGGTYVDPALVGDLLGAFIGKSVLKGIVREPELSEREEAVIKLIARGYSNKEIAAHLDISTKTVETYKARSMEKLGFTNRADIVTFALQRGWMTNL